MANNTLSETEEPSSGHPGFSLRSIARTVWKRKVCIISIWILLSLAAVAIVRQLPPIYVAEALILVDSQKIPEKFVSATVASDLDNRIAAIRQTLLSGGELKKIIDDFGLYQKERKTHFEEEILELMRGDISITLEPVSGKDKQPGAFRIGYQGSDPGAVTRVANRLTDLYVEQNLKTREGQAEGTAEFLDTQLKEAKKRLDELEAAVSSYKLKHNGELPQQETSLASGLSGLHTRLQANLDAINRAQQTKIIQESALSAMEANAAAQMRALDPAGRAAGAPVAAAPGAQTSRKTSEILQERLEMLLAEYTDKHPDVINLRAALEAAKRFEEQQQARELTPKPKSTNPPAGVGGDPPPVLTAEPVELAHTREQIAGLKAQIKVAETELVNRTIEQQRILRDIDRYQSRIEGLPVREQEMAQITRDYEMSKDNYKSLLDKRMAATMALDMERRQQSERFTILDRARTPEKPVKPKKPLLYALGSLGSLVLGLLAGFIIELRRDVFLGEWELPDDTTVLARLPYIEVPAQSSGTGPRFRGKGIGGKKESAAASLALLCLPGVLTGGLLSVLDRL